MDITLAQLYRFQRIPEIYDTDSRKAFPFHLTLNVRVGNFLIHLPVIMVPSFKDLAKAIGPNTWTFIQQKRCRLLMITGPEDNPRVQGYPTHSFKHHKFDPILYYNLKNLGTLDYEHHNRFIEQGFGNFAPFRALLGHCFSLIQTQDQYPVENQVIKFYLDLRGTEVEPILLEYIDFL